MIITEFEQGSEEWLQVRSGIPTASEFSKIITMAGSKSTSQKTYMNTILADWCAGKPVDTWEGNDWTQRGNELEPEARKLYELITGNKVEQVGFCFKDDKKMSGCSPDGLLGDDGLLELKCPKASTLIGYIFDDKVPSKYFQQVQGQLWVTGRKWCDFMAYHPEFEPFIVRVERDEKFLALLGEIMKVFTDTMLGKRQHLMKIKAA